MRNEKTMPYALCPMPLLAFLLCLSVVSAQEIGLDAEKSYAEMMEDAEFQKFLKITEEAFPQAAQPVLRGEPDAPSRFNEMRRQQMEENERNRDTIGYKRWEYDFYIPYNQPQRSWCFAVKIDVRQGKLRETGGEFDLAIEGNGFFRVVDLETAQILHTRCGTFERDEQGFLSLIQGWQVFRLTPEIAVPEELDSFQVGEDGQFRLTTETGEQTTGRLELAVFPNPKRLIPVDDRCFAETSLSGKPRIRQPTQKNAGKIRQGFLEESNLFIGL